MEFKDESKEHLRKILTKLYNISLSCHDLVKPITQERGRFYDRRNVKDKFNDLKTEFYGYIKYVERENNKNPENRYYSEVFSKCLLEIAPYLKGFNFFLNMAKIEKSLNAIVHIMYPYLKVR